MKSEFVSRNRPKRHEQRLNEQQSCNARIDPVRACEDISDGGEVDPKEVQGQHPVRTYPVCSLVWKTALEYCLNDLKADPHVEGWGPKVCVLDPGDVCQERSVNCDAKGENESWCILAREHEVPKLARGYAPGLSSDERINFDMHLGHIGPSQASRGILQIVPERIAENRAV